MTAVAEFFDYDPEQASNAWPAGVYEATIEKVEEGLSKKNNDPMLTVRLKVYGRNGNMQNLPVYITNPAKETGRKGSLFQLRAISVAVGLYEEFKARKLRPKHLVGKNLTVTLTVDDNPEFGVQNRVGSFGKLERLSAATKDDDEIPF